VIASNPGGTGQCNFLNVVDNYADGDLFTLNEQSNLIRAADGTVGFSQKGLTVDDICFSNSPQQNFPSKLLCTFTDDKLQCGYLGYDYIPFAALYYTSSIGIGTKARYGGTAPPDNFTLARVCTEPGPGPQTCTYGEAAGEVCQPHQETIPQQNGWDCTTQCERMSYFGEGCTSATDDGNGNCVMQVACCIHQAS
jgi:hypothetical protein